MWMSAKWGNAASSPTWMNVLKSTHTSTRIAAHGLMGGQMPKTVPPHAASAFEGEPPVAPWSWAEKVALQYTGVPVG